jgi:hypothetical protein
MHPRDQVVGIGSRGQRAARRKGGIQLRPPRRRRTQLRHQRQRRPEVGPAIVGGAAGSRCGGRRNLVALNNRLRSLATIFCPAREKIASRNIAAAKNKLRLIKKEGAAVVRRREAQKGQDGRARGDHARAQPGYLRLFQ